MAGGYPGGVGHSAWQSSRPDEPLHRLVAADWLEQHGGEDDRLRACFIRDSVALESMPVEPPMSCSAMRFTDARMARHHSENCAWCLWTDEWRPRVHAAHAALKPYLDWDGPRHALARGPELGAQASSVAFRLGLPVGLHCQQGDWFAHGPRWLDFPLARVRFLGVSPRWPVTSADGVYWCPGPRHRGKTGDGAYRVRDDRLTSHLVAPPLYALLRGGRPGVESHEPRYYYPNTTDALVALSDAALRWAGRLRARLARAAGTAG